MSRRPPRATVFPYAALFRSAVAAAPVGAAVSAVCPQRLAVGGGTAPICADRTLEARDERVRRLVVVVHGTGRNADDYQDRKSTRLNSSHANMSYAVFCMTKK